jgi:hypothetical protein
VVVNDFNIMGLVIDPSKTHSPLAIDPDAPLACAFPFKRLQVIARRDAQLKHV